MTEPTTPRIPASLQRRPAQSTASGKILALGASVAAGVSLVGVMAVAGLSEPPPAPQAAPERVVVVRVAAPTVTGEPVPLPAAASSNTATPATPSAPNEVTATVEPPAPPPTTVSEGS